MAVKGRFTYHVRDGLTAAANNLQIPPDRERQTANGAISLIFGSERSLVSDLLSIRLSSLTRY